MIKNIKTIILVLLSGALLSGCAAKAPETADDLLHVSVQAYGGDAKTSWNSLRIIGKVEMDADGMRFNADYNVYAEKPDKYRMEKDLSPDGGRFYFTYMYNNGVGWSQRNLQPSTNDGMTKSHKEMFDRLSVAHYFHDNGTIMDYNKNGKTDAGKSAYVISMTIEQDTIDLYFDKKTMYLVQEDLKTTAIIKRNDNEIVRKIVEKRIYSDFKKFSDATFATKIDETIKITQGDRDYPSANNYVLNEIKFDVPIEAWMFTEDMPDKGNK